MNWYKTILSQRGRPLKFNYIQQQQIIELYQQRQMSIYRIAEQYRVSPITIKNILLKNHIPLRRDKDSPFSPTKTHITPEQKGQIIALLKNKMSYWQIAKITGIHESTLRSFLKREGRFQYRHDLMTEKIDLPQQKTTISYNNLKVKNLT